jgi:ParB family transcriptional regulator, chromosome partitioning protein
MAAATLPAKRGNLHQYDPLDPDLKIIGLDTKDGPEHELYDERVFLPLDEAMVLNIMAIGVKEPITLRKRPEGRLDVVDGRGRLRAAREAQKRLRKLGEDPLYIPALFEDGDEVHVQGVMISLNEIRRDDNVVVKAEKCLRLLARNGNDIKAAALRFGVTTAAVKNWVKMASLASKVKKAVAAGEISASAAAELHGLEKEDQIAKLDKLVATAKASGKKRASTASAKKAAGKSAGVPKRVLVKLVDDEELSSKIEPEVAFGIKLAIGAHVPGETTKLGKLLVQAGYKY